MVVARSRSRSPLRSISRISPSIMRRVTSESRRRIVQVVLGERHGHRLRVEEVAEQHRDVVAPAAVHAAAAAPHRGLVDDVVVEQGRGVDELHHRGEQDRRGRRGSRRAGSARSSSAGRMRLPPPSLDVAADLAHAARTSERTCSSKSSSTLTRSSSTRATISLRSGDAPSAPPDPPLPRAYL